MQDASRRTIICAATATTVALTFGRRLGVVAAQEATPAPKPVGVVGTLLGAGVPTSTPGMQLALFRTTIAPGGSLPPHSHPGPFVIAVDAGTWGYTPQQGSVKLTRAAVAGGTPAPAEEAPLGAELILTKGDFLFIEDASQDWMRNAGEDEVVLLISALFPVGQPFTTLLPETGTPTP